MKVALPPGPPVFYKLIKQIAFAMDLWLFYIRQRNGYFV